MVDYAFEDYVTRICVCFERGVLKWDLSGKVLMGEREGEGLAGLRPE